VAALCFITRRIVVLMDRVGKEIRVEEAIKEKM
jgi:transcription elongation factor